jgi:uncharacterized membrane protein
MTKKPFYALKSFWVSVVTLVALIAGAFFGIDVSDEAQAELVDNLTIIGGSLVAVIAAVVGFFKLKNKNSTKILPFALLVTTLALMSGCGTNILGGEAVNKGVIIDGKGAAHPTEKTDVAILYEEKAKVAVAVASAEQAPFLHLKAHKDRPIKIDAAEFIINLPRGFGRGGGAADDIMNIKQARSPSVELVRALGPAAIGAASGYFAGQHVVDAVGKMAPHVGTSIHGLHLNTSERSVGQVVLRDNNYSGPSVTAPNTTTDSHDQIDNSTSNEPTEAP